MVRSDIAASDARKVPLRPRRGSVAWYLDVPVAVNYLSTWLSECTHTVELAQASFLAKLEGRYAETVIFDRASAAREVNRGFYLGRFRIQRILQELQRNSRKRDNCRRRLDLGDHLGGQGQYSSRGSIGDSMFGANGRVSGHDVVIGLAGAPSAFVV